MDIKFVKKSGQILSCSIDGKIKKTDDIITVADSYLPQDFLAMFPLCKYLVKKGKLIENKKFVVPEIKVPTEND